MTHRSEVGTDARPRKLVKDAKNRVTYIDIFENKSIVLSVKHFFFFDTTLSLSLTHESTPSLTSKYSSMSRFIEFYRSYY